MHNRVFQGLLVGVLFGGFLEPARAQQAASTALFGRLMEQDLAQLAKDTAVAARAPGLRGMALMQAAGDSALYFLDDVGLRDLSLLFAESAARAEPAACARL